MAAHQAQAALDAGRLDDAHDLFLAAYDEDPGVASIGLCRVALARRDYVRAENLARAATENGRREAFALLAQAIGGQARRAEAAQIARVAIEEGPQPPGYARMVLAEQLIRMGDWEEGALQGHRALEEARVGEVDDLVDDLVTDLTKAHAAGRLDTVEVSDFLYELFAAARPGGHVERALERAITAISSGTDYEREPSSSAPPRHAPPPVSSSSGNDSIPNVPALVAVMRRDRQLNAALQDLVHHPGIPAWPTEIQASLDPIPPLRPERLGFSDEKMRQNTLALTTGDVATEILVERAQQQMLRALKDRGLRPPSLDAEGLTKLEVALWDGAFAEMEPIAQIYKGKREFDPRVLGLGAFIGDCITRDPEATWTFDVDPARSHVTIVGKPDYRPFDVATRWVEASDKDDVWLEEGMLTYRSSGPSLRIDPTRGLQGSALSMKLAEQWLLFRGQATTETQTMLAQRFRPLNVLEEVVFFAIDAKLLPRHAKGPDETALNRGEGAVAYVRATGEFLLLGSRKHFARAAGLFLKELDAQSAALAADLFKSFHRPGWKLAPNGPRFGTQNGAQVVMFQTTGGLARLTHRPAAAIPWTLQIGE